MGRVSQNKIDFNPMPKRFMVWDKRVKQWWGSVDKAVVFNDIVELGIFFSQQVAAGISLKKIVVVQSTNLFDKYGEEIFEGSIIDYNGDGEALGVVVSIDGQWQLKDKNGNLMFLKDAPHQKLVGHILSNPELLEKKDV